MTPISRIDCSIRRYFTIFLMRSVSCRVGRISSRRATMSWRSKASLTAAAISAARSADALGQRPRHGVHRLGAQQGHEMLVVEQLAQGVDDEQQAILRQAGLLDQQLLAIGLLAV